MSHVTQKNQPMFFILTLGRLSVNIRDLRAPSLAGPAQLYQGYGPPSCATPLHLTMFKQGLLVDKFFFSSKKCRVKDTTSKEINNKRLRIM